MAELSAGAQKLLPFLSDLTAGISERDTTAELWDRVNAAAESQGFTLTGASATSMNEIRSFIVANRNASEAFMAADTNASLQAQYIGQELYNQPGNTPDSQRLYNVRFSHTVVEDGVELDVWRTDQIRGLLPPTKDQLMGLLDSDAQLLADEYNQTHVGIGSVSIAAAF